MTEKKRNNINFSTQLEIYEYLSRQDILCVLDSGLCEYQDGWSDEAVAAALTSDENPVTTANVRNVRLQKFGQIRLFRNPVPEPLPELPLTNTAALEKQISDLAVILKVREQQFDELRNKMIARDNETAAMRQFFEGRVQALVNLQSRMVEQDRRMDGIDAALRELTVALGKIRLANKFA